MIPLGENMLRNRGLMHRRLHEGRHFLRFLRQHRATATG